MPRPPYVPLEDISQFVLAPLAPPEILSSNVVVSMCSCFPLISGNCRSIPTLLFSGTRPVEAEPECRQDSDCPSRYGCINQRCQNPCTVGDVCSRDQECRVLDTLPLRTIMCQCPSDTVNAKDGTCRPIGKFPYRMYRRPPLSLNRAKLKF